MSLCIENESPLPINVAEGDSLTIDLSEEEIPTMETLSWVPGVRSKVFSVMDWSGKG